MTTLASPYQRGYDELRQTQAPSKTNWQRPPVPERTHQQRLDALEKANRVRVQRAKLKKDIKEGRESVFGYLMAPPEFILTMKVWDLCLAKPGYGRVKVNKIFLGKRISPSKTVGALTLRQRQELAQLFS